MRDNVNNRMLALPLDDCHIPAFCSFSKPYFGYAEDMEDFFEALKTEKNTEYLLKTYESFKAGNSIQYNGPSNWDRLWLRIWKTWGACLHTS